nr:twin-arginine translocase TatA/TatE family subunit [Paenibacillus sp. J2TS4]
MAGIGASGLILILLVMLLLFGPSKLPELGRAIGSTLREFKNGTRGILYADVQEDEETLVSNVMQADSASKRTAS